MSDLIVYLAQVDQFWEDKQKNFQHLESLFEQTIFEKGALLLLPEMFNTAFTTNGEKNAEEWGQSLSILWLMKISKKYQIAIGTSLIIKEKGSFYNRFVLVENDTILNQYDKNHLFSLAKEDLHFKPGTERKIFTYKGWKILPLICYDLRFPELSRIDKMVDDGALYDVLIYVANWPEKRIPHWDTLLKARAIENLTYCIGVNRIGIDGNELIYNGHSQAINPKGELISSILQNKEEIKKINLEESLVSSVRNTFGFLKDIK